MKTIILGLMMIATLRSYDSHAQSIINLNPGYEISIGAYKVVCSGDAYLNQNTYSRPQEKFQCGAKSEVASVAYNTPIYSEWLDSEYTAMNQAKERCMSTTGRNCKPVGCQRRRH